jgi:hypothetical protein
VLHEWEGTIAAVLRSYCFRDTSQPVCVASYIWISSVQLTSPVLAAVRLFNLFITHWTSVLKQRSKLSVQKNAQSNLNSFRDSFFYSYSAHFLEAVCQQFDCESARVSQDSPSLQFERSNLSYSRSSILEIIYHVFPAYSVIGSRQLCGDRPSMTSSRPIPDEGKSSLLSLPLKTISG